MTVPLVRIHYLRPPDRLQIFEQHLVHDAPDVKVTLKLGLQLKRPMVVEGRTVSEDGAAIVWFTFPGLWHDVGRFHRADGTFTGCYANVLTPVEIEPGHRWRTTDLFLDVWLDERGPRVLDEDEMEDAIRRGWVDAETAERARAEAELLRSEAAAGRWPPPVVHEWTLERARDALEP